MSLKSKHQLIVNDMPAAVKAGLIHPNYKQFDPLLPEELTKTMVDANAYAEGALLFKRSFPDQRSEAVWAIEEGDMTALRWRWSGTFTGVPFQGLEPNGKRIVYEGMTMYRWKNEQVVEGMSLYDAPGFMKALTS